MKFAEGLHVAHERLRTHAGNVCVVVIDGHSAAGKSSFAAALAKATAAAIVSGDDFYRVMDDDARARLSRTKATDAITTGIRPRQTFDIVGRGDDAG